MNFICGTYFKQQCWLQLVDYKDERTPEFSVKHNKSAGNNYVFCIPEFLEVFKDINIVGDSDFVLFTHNSDINFTDEYVEAVVDLFPNMTHWYAQNLVCDHPKVSPIPIGIANPKWSHGNQDRFKKVIAKKTDKTKDVYVNFNTSTNPKARNYCLEQLGTSLETEYPNAAIVEDHDSFVNSTQEKYLTNIASSRFTVSPIGNGVDCHKTWEAIYMKSVPIVTRWSGVETFKKLGIPILIIDDWKEFKDLDLSEQLYADIWQDFDPSSLDLKTFLNEEHKA